MSIGILSGGASISCLLIVWLLQVIQNVGLCVGFYDLLESSDGLIGHGTGLVNVNGRSPCLLYACMAWMCGLRAD